MLWVMLTSNYFRANGHYVFFDDSTERETRVAFDTAVLKSEGRYIVMYEPPPHEGPWDNVGLVGFRARPDIVADLHRTVDEERLMALSEELRARDKAFYDAGREVLTPRMAA